MMYHASSSLSPPLPCPRLPLPLHLSCNGCANNRSRGNLAGLKVLPAVPVQALPRRAAAVEAALAPAAPLQPGADGARRSEPSRLVRSSARTSITSCRLWTRRTRTTCAPSSRTTSSRRPCLRTSALRNSCVMQACWKLCALLARVSPFVWAFRWDGLFVSGSTNSNG